MFLKVYLLCAKLNTLPTPLSVPRVTYNWIKRKAITQDTENTFYITNASFSIGPDSVEKTLSFGAVESS